MSEPPGRYRTASQLGLPSRRSARSAAVDPRVPETGGDDIDTGRRHRWNGHHEAPTPAPAQEPAPEPERRHGRRARTPTMLSGIVGEMLADVTPPPTDIGALRVAPSTADTWQHADHIQQRVVSALAKMASVSDAEMAKLSGKVKVVKWIVVAVLVPLIGAVIAAGTYLYTRGYDAGVAASWRQTIEQRIDRLEGRPTGRT